MPVITIPLTLALPATQKKTNALIAKLSALVCRAKGSCSPKIINIVQKIGYAGYRRGSPDKWNYYLDNGIHLSWDLSKFYNAQNWYFGSGYWQRLKDAGLDNCCLKSKWPPAEAFPIKYPNIKPHQLVELPNGDKLEVDSEVFDMNNWQRELQEYQKANPNSPIVPQDGQIVTPPLQGNALLPLGLLYLFAR